MKREEVFLAMKDETEALCGAAISDPSMDLLDSGVLDSLNIVNLVTFMEKRFSLSLGAYDLDMETFRTLEGMTDFIMKKIQE